MVKRSGLAMEEFKADAQQFKPSRWLESDGQPLKTNPKGFMPFGGVSIATHEPHQRLLHFIEFSLPPTCMTFLCVARCRPARPIDT